MALNADGFHSSEVGIGPTLIDSEISWTGDDFLNIHNKMKIVCQLFNDNKNDDKNDNKNDDNKNDDKNDDENDDKNVAGMKFAVIDSGVSFEQLVPGDTLTFFHLLSGTPHVANNEINGIGHGRRVVASVRHLNLTSSPTDVKLLKQVT